MNFKIFLISCLIFAVGVLVFIGLLIALLFFPAKVLSVYISLDALILSVASLAMNICNLKTDTAVTDMQLKGPDADTKASSNPPSPLTKEES